MLRDDRGLVTGVRPPTRTAQRVEARLTVARDGRHSAVREAIGLHPREFGAPMDVLWFRLPRRESDGGTGVAARVGYGQTHDLRSIGATTGNWRT